MFTPEIINKVKMGKIGVLPTDTLYGIVGSALLPATVERIYSLRKRDLGKPMVVLLGDMADLGRFDLKPEEENRLVLESIWPEKVSVVLACLSKKFQYLHRGTKTLAFRIPKDEALRKLLEETGPLVAPSANIQGQEAAETIEEARKIFGDQVGFYIDGGKKTSEPSTVISLIRGKIKVLRQGAFSVDSFMKN